jgi:hypothetical protein
LNAVKVNERLIFAVRELIIILCLTGITFELGRAFALRRGDIKPAAVSTSS